MDAGTKRGTFRLLFVKQRSSQSRSLKLTTSHSTKSTNAIINQSINPAIGSVSWALHDSLRVATAANDVNLFYRVCTARQIPAAAGHVDVTSCSDFVCIEHASGPPCLEWLHYSTLHADRTFHIGFRRSMCVPNGHNYIVR